MWYFCVFREIWVYRITHKDLELLQKYDSGYLIELYWFPYFVHKNNFNADVLAGDQSQFAKNSKTKFLATENVISHGGAQRIGLNGEETMFTIDLFGTEGLVCIRFGSRKTKMRIIYVKWFSWRLERLSFEKHSNVCIISDSSLLIFRIWRIFICKSKLSRMKIFAAFLKIKWERLQTMTLFFYLVTSINSKKQHRTDFVSPTWNNCTTLQRLESNQTFCQTVKWTWFAFD